MGGIRQNLPCVSLECKPILRRVGAPDEASQLPAIVPGSESPQILGRLEGMLFGKISARHSSYGFCMHGGCDTISQPPIHTKIHSRAKSGRAHDQPTSQAHLKGLTALAARCSALFWTSASSSSHVLPMTASTSST